MNDLNILNRILTIKFELRKDWYTNKGQISSTTNEGNDVSLGSVAQRDSISSVHELILITSQQPRGTVLCNKTKCLYRPTTQRDCASDSIILCTKSISVKTK